MSTLLSAYAKHHLIGRDCRLTALRNTFSYYGTVETYPAMFGLSATFGFGYRDRPFGQEERENAPDCDTTAHYFPIVGNSLDCIGGIAATFGAHLERSAGDDEERSFDMLMEHLDQGRPVMVALARDFLNRCTGRTAHELDVVPEISFGGHWVVLVDANRREGTVTFFEPDLEKPLTVAEDVFRAARTWGDEDPNCFVKSRAAWAVCIPPAERRSRAEILRLASAEIVKHSREIEVGESPNASLRVLGEFATSFPTLRTSAELPAQKLKATIAMLRFQGQMLTGGGLGRRLFASFLRQGVRDTKNDRIVEAQAECVRLAQSWDALIDLLYAEVVDGDTTDLAAISDLRERMQSIVSGETALVHHLDCFVQEATCC